MAGITFTFQSAIAAPVKQSDSGICHDQHSSYYERTKSYTGFGTLAACLDSGGRLPAGYDGPGVKTGTSAKEAMEQAQIEQRPSTPVYDRDDYPHWSDFDGDCQDYQDQRHELLIKTSQIPVTFTDPDECYVDSGRWYDPYTGRTYTDASDLHVDHIVSLKYAHERSAAYWTTKRKEQFANAWLNIIPVDAGTNRRVRVPGGRVNGFLRTRHIDALLFNGTTRS